MLNLLKPMKIASSYEGLLKEEIQYLKMFFIEISEYPKHFVDNILRKERQNKEIKNKVNPDDRETYKMQIMLLYGEEKGCKLMTKIKKHFKKSLPNNIKTIVTYQSKKLFKKFYVKDETNFCYKNNLVYHGKCSSENFRHD